MRHESRISAEHLIADMLPVTIVIAAATLALVAVSLMTRPPPREVVDRFVLPWRP